MYIQNLIASSGPKNFGWVPHAVRTPEQTKLNFDLIAAMPQFKLKGSGNYNTSGGQSQIWDCVRKLNSGANLKALYQQIGSCFPADSMVLMADGTQKPIQDIQIGDIVVTHKNRARKVNKLFQVNYTGKLYEMEVNGSTQPIRATADHKFPIWSNISTREGNRYTPGDMKWTPISEFKSDDRVLMVNGINSDTYQELDLTQYFTEDKYQVVNSYITRKQTSTVLPAKIKVDEKFARLIGLYLAEGGVQKKTDGTPTGIQFSFSSEETEFCEEVISLLSEFFGVKSYLRTSQIHKHVLYVECNSTFLGEFFDEFINGNVYTKYVPDVFFKSPLSVKKSLLRGWWDGDGYVQCELKSEHGIRNRLRGTGTSSSYRLHADMTRICLNCGLKPTSYYSKKESHQTVAVGRLDIYSNDVLDLYPEYQEKIDNSDFKVSKGMKHVKIDAGYLCKINNLSHVEVKELFVYNFEVEEDNSYVINGIATKNCVGHGLCNAEWYLQFVQNIIKGKRETPVLPYEPYGYAQSRVCAGISGNSDGSTGTGAADASKLYGMLDSRIDGLPAFKDEAETITFSGSTDKSWGNRGAPSQYLTEGKKHLVKTVSLIRSSDDAAAALYNNYPLTLASDWGGKMMPDLREGVLLNSHADTWNHQMSCTNVWDHPILKIIFYIQNSWSATAHGRGPNGEPLGGFWILRKDMDYIIAQQEVFAFSDEDGFPERRIDKSLLMLI